MRRKHGFRAALCSILAASLLPLQAAAYTDTASHWARQAIDRWSGEYGILKGYDDGSFRPDNTITRGAFAGILDRFLQYREAASADTFSDTKGDYWEASILRLNAAGVYLGTDGKALIYHDITRQQAVAMICRAFGIPESDGTLPYADAGTVANYARGFLATLAERGAVTDVGKDRCFRPTDAITRAEVVNLLNNLIAALYQSSGDYTGDVKGDVLVNAAEGASFHDMKISGDLILAPGVAGKVTLTDVTLDGEIRNLGDAEVETFTTPEPEIDTTPEPEAATITYEGRTVPALPGVPVNPLKAEDFAWDENGRLYCVSEEYTASFGIDVSAYQNRNCEDQTIDWEAAAADGVEFAMVRIALRGTGSGALYPDAFYAQNIDGAMAAGIDTGVYIFSQAISVEEAVEEADYVIELLEGRQLTGPVAWDWEMKDSSYRVYGTDPETVTSCAKAFCQRIREAGYQPMIYTSRYVGYFKLDWRELSEVPVWYPEYKYTSTAADRVVPSYYYQLDYWQYTDAARVDGISGKVDGDLRLTRR